LRKINQIGILVGSFIYMEILLRIFTNEKFFNVGLMYLLLFSVAVSMALLTILSFFKPTTCRVTMGIIIVFISFVFISQLVYYDIFDTFYTIYTAGKAFHAMEFFMDAVFNAIKNIHWILFMLLPGVTYFLFSSKRMKLINWNWLQRIVVMIIIFILAGTASVGIKIESHKGSLPNGELMLSGHPVVLVNHFGLMITMGSDFSRTVFGVEPSLEPPVLNEKIIKRAAELDELRDEKQYNDVDIAIPKFELNKLDIDFEQLSLGTDDEIIKNMNDYFKLVKPSSKNDYTGMFEGYNLIMITAESFTGYAVDKEITPTLYQLTHEGFNFTNFYNPLWGVSTSDGEYVAMTGLIPKIGVWSMYHSGSNHVPYAMGNMLKARGYKTMAFHNHTYTYYERHISHPNMGYEYKGLGNGLDVTPTWPESDIEMMELSIDDYIGHEPFHTYYMTVSGHMRYSFSGNYIALKNKDLVQDLPYSDAVKAYFATQIELDRALEYLMERLEQAGIAERTLIVLSSDHYPYALEKEEFNELAGFETDDSFDVYHSGLIVYAKGMKPEIVDKPISSLDILPTVMNLMGLEFDSRLLMGRDVFSEAKPLVIFANKSFITDLGKYNYLTQEFEVIKENEFKNKEEENDYVLSILEEIERKFYYSTMILDKDYYRHIFIE